MGFARVRADIERKYVPVDRDCALWGRLLPLLRVVLNAVVVEHEPPFGPVGAFVAATFLVQPTLLENHVHLGKACVSKNELLFALD